MSETAYEDLVTGRLVEAHADAAAINRELDGPVVEPGQRWGVWAAGPADSVRATRRDGGWVLDGVKAWCSGATVATHSLVTAGERLFAVELAHPGFLPADPSWAGAGMSAADTRSVGFEGVPAVPVGSPGDYLTRPGFWIGAIGVAACWHGGSARLASALLARARTSVDPHLFAHLGAVYASLDTCASLLRDAGRRVDVNPSGSHAVLARSVRNTVERAAVEIADRCGRALGPGPLAHDGCYSALLSDLTVYVRQHHAERDLEALGRDLINQDPRWLP